MASGTIPKHRIAEVILMDTNTDVSSTPAQVDLSVPYDAFTFLVIRFASGSADSSSNRGVMLLPTAAMGAGAFYPIYVGTTAGYVRLGAGDTSSKLKVQTTSFQTLYIRAVYGIY